MHKEVPFISQLSDVDMSQVSAEYGFIHDKEAAARFGVRLFAEFSYWAWRACGIANVAMVLAAEGRLVETLYDLVCEALLDNGYAFKNRWGGQDVGWKYSSLCTLLRRRGFSTKIYLRLSLDEVAALLEQQRYVILSVESATGGHMVLVTGISGGFITYHDPYTFAGRGGANVREVLTSFAPGFLERGIVAW